MLGPEDCRDGAWLDRADAVIVRAARLFRAEIERASRLRVIGKHGVGLDAIDLAAARERGIAVVSTPRANAVSVAELAVGPMPSLARGPPLPAA